MRWLVKQRRPEGSDSIVDSDDLEWVARNIADNMNHDYQTDEYYVEPWKYVPKGDA